MRGTACIADPPSFNQSAEGARPVHAIRTRRALLTHRAPTLDGDEEPLLRPRMQDAWERMVRLIKRFLPSPRVLHPWPNHRFNVKYSR